MLLGIAPRRPPFSAWFVGLPPALLPQGLGDESGHPATKAPQFSEALGGCESSLSPKPSLSLSFFLSAGLRQCDPQALGPPDHQSVYLVSALGVLQTVATNYVLSLSLSAMPSWVSLNKGTQR